MPGARVAWQHLSVRERLAVVRRLRGIVADRAKAFAESVPRDPAETLVAEVLPLAEACRFLEREAESLLAPRRLDHGRPLWLQGVSLEIHREPVGTVLVIGPANYPLFLPAVHTLQALVAGNSVLLKPGTGGFLPMQMLTTFLAEAGLPSGVLTLLGEDPQEAQDAITKGVDKVILTGSNATGQAVMRTLAEHVTPSVMELSGCDSVFVLGDADLDLVAGAVRFGLTLNEGNTCIAPKRIYVARALAAESMIEAMPPGTVGGKGGIAVVRIADVSSKTLAPLKGRRPVNISNRMTPSAQRSLRASAAPPLSTSGAMYATVPTIMPGSVSDTAVAVASPASAVRFARPKSRIFTLPSGAIATFALFRSRCTTPRWCACARPSAIWMA